MNKRSLAARLKRLEFRRAPDYQQHTFDICAVNSKGETLYIMRLGQPKNQYFAPDGKPITKVKPTVCLRLRKWRTCNESDAPTPPPA